MVNLEEIATASPRMQGMSFGPADLAASRRMKTTRVGGGHPGYLVINDPDPDDPEAPRATAQQDPWHYSIARMVDACTSAGILPFYGPYGDIKDTAGCEAQFRAAFLLGCVGTWTLHPVQIEIAKKVFSPDPEEVRFAKKVIEAIPDGRGVHMIDGKMQDDATWKQCKVMVDLAEQLAEGDPELAEAYGSGRLSLAPGARPRVAGPLRRVRPAGHRLQLALPRVLRRRAHRAMARGLGSYDEPMIAEGVDLVVAEAGIRFRSSLRFDDVFEIRATLARIGETSTTTAFALARDGELVAEGELRHVFVARDGGVKTEIPARIRAALEPYRVD